jgi:tetratricopeptide (TPR) repeat protein
METLTILKRGKEFIVLADRALRGGYLKDQPKSAAAVRYMRGQCLEADGRLDEALVDYEDTVRLDGTHWGALNNAAWYIARNVPDRIAAARAYIDRAMSFNAEDPSVLDTAAEVCSVEQNLEGALELIDKVLQLAADAKRPSYIVHKAEILLRAEREEDAKALLLSVRREYGDNPASQRARTLLWEIDHRHLPEEEPLEEQLPAPEEEEKRPGTGGGE